MYLTFSDFQKICPEGEISEEQFENFECRAEMDINSLTFNRINAHGFDALTEHQKSLVQYSIAMQMKFIHENSELLDSPLGAYSISGISMSFDRTKTVSLGGVVTTNQVYSTLMQTGLCYRGLR